MKISSLDSLFDDIESVADQPKWISTFRDKYYLTARLPFLIVYIASAIATTEDSSLFGNKSAIAIATKQLQSAGCLIQGSNKLSERGDIREVAVMSRLGKRKTEAYIRDFERI